MRLLMMPLLAAVLSFGLANPVAAAPKAGTTKTVTKQKAASKAAKPSAGKAKTAAAKSRKVAAATKTVGKNKAKAGGKTKRKSAAPKMRGKARAASRSASLQQAAVVEEAVPNTESVVVADGKTERVYDGMLPTPDEKIIMPVALDTNGRAECVQLLKTLMDAPRTLFWKEGRKLKASWDQLKPGTAIATFNKGHYPQQPKGPGGKHAAIFLRATQAGIYVFDQFAGKLMAEERFIPWHHPKDKRPSNNANAYSTVRW